MPISLSQIIAHVGDEHIKVQRLDESMTVITAGKHGSEVTFETAQVSPADFLDPARPPAMHGLIIWLPREKLVGLSK